MNIWVTPKRMLTPGRHILGQPAPCIMMGAFALPTTTP